MNWDACTAVFLWNFKPEWRIILPLPEDDEESSLLASHNVSVAADSTVIANGHNNSTLDDVKIEEHHVDDGFEDQNSTSEDIDDVMTPDMIEFGKYRFIC
jgi:hypothetical protein